jgi:hypothetical protein
MEDKLHDEMIQIQADLMAAQNRIKELEGVSNQLKTAADSSFLLQINKSDNLTSFDVCFECPVSIESWTYLFDMEPEDVALLVELLKGVVARAKRSQIEFYDRRHADLEMLSDDE